MNTISENTVISVYLIQLRISVRITSLRKQGYLNAYEMQRKKFVLCQLDAGGPLGFVMLVGLIVAGRKVGPNLASD